GPIGVDVEHMRREPDVDALAARFFAAEEIDALATLAAHERVTGFYRCWTRKEAYVKALGVSVWGQLTRFAVSIDSESARFLRRDDAATEPAWCLYALPLDGAYVGALVVARADATIAVRTYEG